MLKQLNLRIIFGITLTAVMGVASIAPAFPQMVDALQLEKGKIGLLITVFTLPGIVLTPFLGILADRLGRKKILTPSLFLFGIAGVACAFTESFTTLLVLRFIQGIGGAALGALNATLIGDIYSGKQRAEAMGYNASVLSIGTALYPAIGGFLATFGWNYPFLLPLLSIPVGLLVLFKLDNPEPENIQPFKAYMKGVLRTISTADAILLFGASIITFIVLYGSFLTYFPLLTGNVFHAEPYVIGGLMSTMSAVTAITSSRLKQLINHFTHKQMVFMAFLFYGIAMMLIPFINNIWLLTVPIIIFGIGHGLNIPNIQTLLARIAPIENRGSFMSVNGMVLRIGQTIGPLIMATVYGLWEFWGTFFLGALLSLVMAGIFVVNIRYTNK